MLKIIILCFTIFQATVCFADLKNSRRTIFPGNESSVPSTINEFAWKLFTEIKPVNPLSNLILCPLAVQYQLLLLELGSAGETKSQLQNVAGVGLLPQIANLLNPHTKAGTHIYSGNGIFVDKSLFVNETFESLAMEVGGEVHNIDFSSKPADAKYLINKWVSQNTNGTIQQMLSDDYDVGSLKMLLSSVLYFQSNWKYKMNSSQSRLFFTDSDRAYPMEYMEITQNFNFEKIKFADGIGGELIELPYADLAYSMLLLVPNHRTPLDILIKEISPTNFDSILKRSKDRDSVRMHLIMPKIKATSRVSLVNALLKMGLTDTFGRNSNLPFIAKSSGPLMISDILQQSTIDVNESGTTASSATMSFIIPLSAANEQKIIVDRPFVFVIFDKVNQIPLFISKILLPKSF